MSQQPTIFVSRIQIPRERAPRMGLANRISLCRVLLAPCLVASLLYYDPHRGGVPWVTLGLFLIGILSDALDGFIARSQHQESSLGTVLDPIADKLLILSTLISLSSIRALPVWLRVPAWFNLVVISRDVILVVGTLILFLVTGKFTVKPSRLGKWTIAAQMAVIFGVLLGAPLKTWLLLMTAVLTVLSGLTYVRTGAKLLS